MSSEPASSMSAYSRMSAGDPMPMPCASWIIIRPPAAIFTLSPACARKLAALAARPSMLTFTVAGDCCRASNMLTASYTNPPGELMCTSRAGASTACTACTNCCASRSQPPITSYTYSFGAGPSPSTMRKHGASRAGMLAAARRAARSCSRLCGRRINGRTSKERVAGRTGDRRVFQSGPGLVEGDQASLIVGLYLRVLDLRCGPLEAVEVEPDVPVPGVDLPRRPGFPPVRPRGQHGAGHAAFLLSDPGAPR